VTEAWRIEVEFLLKVTLGYRLVYIIKLLSGGNLEIFIYLSRWLFEVCKIYILSRDTPKLRYHISSIRVYGHSHIMWVTIPV
jgi:hypothetical protein